MNLFLTEDGVLKLGYYGLTTQAEYYRIKGMNCDGVRSFAPEVFKGKYEMQSDVRSFGISLIEMMGIRPCVEYENYYLPTMNEYLRLPFVERSIKSSELIDFLKKCIQKYNRLSASELLIVSERWSVNELLNVSVMG